MGDLGRPAQHGGQIPVEVFDMVGGFQDLIPRRTTRPRLQEPGTQVCHGHGCRQGPGRGMGDQAVVERRPREEIGVAAEEDADRDHAHRGRAAGTVNPAFVPGAPHRKMPAGLQHGGRGGPVRDRVPVPRKQGVRMARGVHPPAFDQAFRGGQHHPGVFGVGTGRQEIVGVSLVGRDEIGDGPAVAAGDLVAAQKFRGHAQRVPHRESQDGTYAAILHFGVHKIHPFVKL